MGIDYCFYLEARITNKKTIKRTTLQKKDKTVKTKAVEGIKVAVRSNPIEGMKFVITGKLPLMGRAEATEIIKDNGGKVVASISMNTDYLLCGEKTGTKLNKTKALGVKIITERKFLKMVPQ